jgi:ATP-dependent helicase HrpB
LRLTRAEILSADLSSFVLDMAQWGASDAGKLAFLDPPPRAALSEAKTLLAGLGAIDSDGRITEEGRKLRALPLPPRLARMVVDAAAEGAGELAAGIAAVVTERGLGGDDVDLRHRLTPPPRLVEARDDARAMVRRWAETAGAGRGQRAFAARCSPWPIPTASRKSRRRQWQPPATGRRQRRSGVTARARTRAGGR